MIGPENENVVIAFYGLCAGAIFVVGFVAGFAACVFL